MIMKNAEIPILPTAENRAIYRKKFFGKRKSSENGRKTDNALFAAYELCVFMIGYN